MSSGSTPCGIGLPEAGPLIDALRDDSPATRLAVLDALTRLPLEPRRLVRIQRVRPLGARGQGIGAPGCDQARRPRPDPLGARASPEHRGERRARGAASRRALRSAAPARARPPGPSSRCSTRSPQRPRCWRWSTPLPSWTRSSSVGGGTAASFSPSPWRRGAERTRSSQSSSGSRATPSSPRSGCTPTRPSRWSKRWRASLHCRMTFAQSSIASGRAGSPGTSSRMSSSRRPRRKQRERAWTTSASEDLSAAERELVREGARQGLAGARRLSGRARREARRRPLSPARGAARAQPLRLAARDGAPLPRDARRAAVGRRRRSLCRRPRRRLPARRRRTAGCMEEVLEGRRAHAQPDRVGGMPRSSLTTARTARARISQTIRSLLPPSSGQPRAGPGPASRR